MSFMLGTTLDTIVEGSDGFHIAFEFLHFQIRWRGDALFRSEVLNYGKFCYKVGVIYRGQKTERNPDIISPPSASASAIIRYK